MPDPPACQVCGPAALALACAHGAHCPTHLRLHLNDTPGCRRDLLTAMRAVTEQWSASWRRFASAITPPRGAD